MRRGAHPIRYLGPAPGRVGGTVDTAASKAVARKSVWVRLPHPAHVVGGQVDRGRMPHFRAQSTVDSALAASDAGVPDAENARRHGVTVQTIRRWRRAYQRQGVTRGQTPCLRRAHSAPGCPSRRSPMRSYWAGLGDGYIILARRGVYSLSIFNDAKYAVVNAHIQDLLRAVKPGCRPHTRRRPGCLVTTVGWKHWPCLSPSTGRAASTSGPSRSQPGSRTSSALIRGTSCAASSIPMAPEWPTGPEEWSPAR